MKATGDFVLKQYIYTRVYITYAGMAQSGSLQLLEEQQGDFVLLMGSNPIPGAGSPQYSRFFLWVFFKKMK